MISVLVVDDSKFMARGIESILAEMGFNVVGVGHDGVQGLELFQQTRPDVTLLDVTMPNMDGLHCLQKIRELDPDAKVVMLSAVKDQDTVDRCIQSGAASFLQKPIKRTSPKDLSRLCETLECAVATTA
ncbi:response regulator [Stieleria varia]|uniref:Chemotaxis protein CheY n=1 Tax=Stieleria varia TaxID=2528005 RepID=A0A5C6B3H4_9BACT|nr:response regulator [Stieleria varia]TWU06307.1 Chemotaxis protein CheY [Stieleria varia]